MVRLTESQAKAYVQKQNKPAALQLDLFGDVAPAARRRKPPKTADVPLEEYEGEMLMHRVKMYEKRHPELQDFAHVPNGGKRDYQVGAAMKRQGVRKGYPDYILQYPSRGYLSLVIELKRRNGVPSDVSPEQRARIERLRAVGNRVVVCYGHEHAIAELEAYLGISMPLQMV